MHNEIDPLFGDAEMRQSFGIKKERRRAASRDERVEEYLHDIFTVMESVDETLTAILNAVEKGNTENNESLDRNNETLNRIHRQLKGM